MSASVRSQRAFEYPVPAPAPSRAHLRELSILQLGKYYPPSRGGIESHLQLLCNELNNLVKLKVLVANESRETIEEACDGVDVRRIGQFGTFQSAPVCPSLINEVRKAKADIVHIHWPNPTALVAYLLSGHQGNLVFTYHSDVVRQRKLAAMFQPVLKRALKKASA